MCAVRRDFARQSGLHAEKREKHDRAQSGQCGHVSVVPGPKPPDAEKVVAIGSGEHRDRSQQQQAARTNARGRTHESEPSRITRKSGWPRKVPCRLKKGVSAGSTTSKYGAPPPRRDRSRALRRGFLVKPYRGRLGRSARDYLLTLWTEAEDAYRKRILELVASAEPTSLLDLGCHDGEWTQQLVLAAGGSVERAAGVELIEDARQDAERRGIEAVAADLNDRLPFADESFDLVHANQVIEHVLDLDHFVTEIARVLRPGGRAIVCTENLASWHNIGALVLGYMPFSLTNISSRGAIGNPLNLASTPAAELETSWFHTRVLTAVGLEHLFRVHAFDVVTRFGTAITRCRPDSHEPRRGEMCVTRPSSASSPRSPWPERLSKPRRRPRSTPSNKMVREVKPSWLLGRNWRNRHCVTRLPAPTRWFNACSANGWLAEDPLGDRTILRHRGDLPPSGHGKELVDWIAQH